MLEISKHDTIYVAGHGGLVGSAIIRELRHQGFNNILTRSHQELDLCSQSQTREFFQQHNIDYVVLAAAKVGGIHANNTYPAEFIYQNLMIQNNVIHQAYLAGVKKLLFLGSSCIYPREAPQPMQEKAILTSQLEPTNEPYAIAKIAGIKSCESYNRQYGTDYRSVMPTNLFGPGDNFHPENSHVVPALIQKFHNAKLNQDNEVSIWGSGKVRREFLYVDDMANACVFLMQLPKQQYWQLAEPMLSHINIGVGEDISIKQLAYSIKTVVGFDGEVVFDTSRPEGTPQKLLDVSKINAMGWYAQTTLEEGLNKAYDWYLKLLANDPANG